MSEQTSSIKSLEFSKIAQFPTMTSLKPPLPKWHVHSADTSISFSQKSSKFQNFYVVSHF